jgi:hypothetical protein
MEVVVALRVMLADSPDNQAEAVREGAANLLVVVSLPVQQEKAQTSCLATPTGEPQHKLLLQPPAVCS